MELKRTDLSLRRERVVLLRVVRNGTRLGVSPLGELARLARTARAHVVGEIVQKRAAPDPAYYVGRGKLEEVQSMCRATDADAVICDGDLAAGQVRTLEEALGLKVLDRSELILDVFATRAQTRQAKLQVELAQLEYALPRLMRMWTHLSRVEGGIGMRGPGERQLETDRRLVRRRIQDLKRQLVRIEQRREHVVRARMNTTCVALVGYTNAGKSTLLNALTGTKTLVEDKLFATLDTKTRRWPLRSGQVVLLSDTVGFIERLPHHLIASFHATLAEVREADLLLHVADASAPQVEAQIRVVRDVLRELGCRRKPAILVLNKMDRVHPDALIPLLRRQYPEAVEISALLRDGLGQLQERVQTFFDDARVEIEVVSDVGSGRLLSFLSEKGRVLCRAFEGDKARVRLLLEERYLPKLHTLDSSAEVVRLTAQPCSPAAEGEL